MSWVPLGNMYAGGGEEETTNRLNFMTFKVGVSIRVKVLTILLMEQLSSRAVRGTTQSRTHKVQSSYLLASFPVRNTHIELFIIRFSSFLNSLVIFLQPVLLSGLKGRQEKCYSWVRHIIGDNYLTQYHIHVNLWIAHRCTPWTWYCINYYKNPCHHMAWVSFIEPALFFVSKEGLSVSLDSTFNARGSEVNRALEWSIPKCWYPWMRCATIGIQAPPCQTCAIHILNVYIFTGRLHYNWTSWAKRHYLSTVHGY